jgi:hypothetical protein
MSSTVRYERAQAEPALLRLRCSAPFALLCAQRRRCLDALAAVAVGARSQAPCGQSGRTAGHSEPGRSGWKPDAGPGDGAARG